MRTLPAMSLDAIVKKYSKRFWDIYNELGYDVSLMSIEGKDAIERGTNELTKLLDELALDGYYVRLFIHAQCKEMRGVMFFPLPPTVLKRIEQMKKDGEIK